MHEYERCDSCGNAFTRNELTPLGDSLLCPDCLSRETTFCAHCGERIFWDENAGELVVLGVAGPNIGQEGSAEDITAFLEENGYTYPVVMDETGTLFYQYGISAYPTTFMIDTEGNVFGYVQGAVSREVMDDIVEQTRSGQRR